MAGRTAHGLGILAAAMAASAACAAAARAGEAAAEGGGIREIFPKAIPSVAMTTFYVEQENGAKNKVHAIGVIAGAGGIVAIHNSLFPKHLPLERFSDIRVKYRLDLSDSREVRAEYLNRDDDLQAVLLKPSEKYDEFPRPVEPGNPASLQAGEPVFALALLPESYGFFPTFCTGFAVRWIDKPKDLLVLTPLLGAQAGSPVFDAGGRFLGVVCFDPLPSKSYRSFGAPLTTVMPAGRLAGFFENPTEKKKRPWLGLAHLQPLTQELAKATGLPDGSAGVIVGQILPGGPAEAAGMKAKDIIIRLAGEKLEAKDENGVRACQERMKELRVGEPVEMALLRDGKETTIRIVPAEWPKEAGEAPRYEDKTLGIVVRELLYWDKLENLLPMDTKGLFVQYIKPGSWPQLGGLSSGDILQKVDDVALGAGPDAIEQFKKAAADLKREKKKKFVMFVSRGLRGENSTYINVEADWDKAPEER